jgi:hypothetical protein
VSVLNSTPCFYQSYRLRCQLYTWQP